MKPPFWRPPSNTCVGASVYWTSSVAQQDVLTEPPKLLRDLGLAEAVSFQLLPQPHRPDRMVELAVLLAEGLDGAGVVAVAHGPDRLGPLFAAY